MEKLKTFLNQYFWLIVVTFLALLAITVFTFYAVFDANSFDKTITDQITESKKAVGEANNANTNTEMSDTTRRSEDVIREKTIAPKLEKARRDSQNSKIELEKAKKTYNEKQNDTDLIFLALTLIIAANFPIYSQTSDSKTVSKTETISFLIEQTKNDRALIEKQEARISDLEN